MLNDRFTNGLLAGTIGAIAMNIIDYLSFYLLKFTHIRFLDYAAVIIFGSKPSTIRDTVFAQLVQILFTGMLSIIFAYLYPKITSKNYLLKGWIFGIMAWFSIYAIGMLFDIALFKRIHPNTAILHFVSSSVYGLVLAETLNRLESRIIK